MTYFQGYKHLRISQILQNLENIYPQNHKIIQFYYLPLVHPQKYIYKIICLKQIFDNPRNFVFSKISHPMVTCWTKCKPQGYSGFSCQNYKNFATQAPSQNVQNIEWETTRISPSVLQIKLYEAANLFLLTQTSFQGCKLLVYQYIVCLSLQFICIIQKICT